MSLLLKLLCYMVPITDTGRMTVLILRPEKKNRVKSLQ